MTIKINAYCTLCKKAVDGNVKEIIPLESGKWLYKADCDECYYEIKRIELK